MTESFFERHARAQRRLTAGRAGKPEFNIDIDIQVPVIEEAAPSTEIAPLFGPAQEIGPDRVVRTTVTQLKVSPKVRDWLKLARELASEKEVNIRDLWVRIDVRPESKCVTFTTSLVSIVLSYRDPAPVAGRLRLFIRFAEFAKVVEQEGVSDFAIEGRKLMYTAMGVARSMDALDRVDGDSFTPDFPPLTGYTLVPDLGLALREAAHFTKKTADTTGRHKVCVWPRKDPTGAGTGMVDFIGCDGPLIYRREINMPCLTNDLFLDPLRALSDESVIPDKLGFLMSGTDVVWLLAETGFIIGLENEPCTVPYEKQVNEYLAAPNGRIEFSVEEAAALRRAVAHIRISPETVGEKEMVIRPRGQSRLLEFGTKQNIQSVPCSGDEGPDGMDVDPDFMSKALTVRGVHALEFNRSDPGRPLLIVSPGVRVALKPLTPLSSIRS